MASVETLRGTRIVLPPVPEAAQRRRSLNQRLYVLLPVLYRLVTRALTRLPPRAQI